MTYSSLSMILAPVWQGIAFHVIFSHVLTMTSAPKNHTLSG